MNTTLVVLFAVVVAYCIPTIVAERRRHQSVSAITAFNFFLGWTILGWVLALVWALSGPNHRRVLS